MVVDLGQVGPWLQPWIGWMTPAAISSSRCFVRCDITEGVNTRHGTPVHWSAGVLRLRSLLGFVAANDSCGPSGTGETHMSREASSISRSVVHFATGYTAGDARQTKFDGIGIGLPKSPPSSVRLRFDPHSWA